MSPLLNLACSAVSARFNPAYNDLGDLLDGFSGTQGFNPNARFKQEFTYITKMHCGNSMGERTPGPSWDVTNAPIIASADGYVTRILLNIEGHPGNSVWVQERDSGFQIRYEHIGKPQVNLMDDVKRGETVLGYGIGYFKMLMFDFNDCIDPDLFGIQHDHMDYLDPNVNYKVENPYVSRGIQREIIKDIVNSYIGDKKQQIQNISDYSKLEHRKPYVFRKNMIRYYRWTPVERFRLLEHLYNTDPTQFKIRQNDFDNLNQNFYNNQPIKLPLPF